MRRAVRFKILITFLAGLALLAPASAWSQEQDPARPPAGWGRLDLKGRAYFLRRDFEKSGLQESLALGLWATYQSPEWRGLSLGLAGYTSQPFLVDDPAHDGGSLLAGGQTGFSALGQAWLQGRVDKTSLRVGRQILETPLINSYDVKMVPVTLEGAVLSDASFQGLQLTAGHLTGIKPWTDTAFQPMSQAAGLAGSEEPVSLAGALWQPSSDLTLQAWEYFCHQFMSMFYAQADLTWPLGRDISLTASGQFIDERDAGRALAGSFNAGQWGLKLDLGWGGWIFTGAYTSARPDHDIENPWGSYPGWTSIMEEDSDRAGEDSWLAAVAYDFSRVGIKGLSAYTMHTFSRTPDSGPHASPDQTEHDLTVDYRFQGRLQGMWLRLRAAHVDQDEALGGEDFTDYRVILNYDFSLGG